MTTGDRIAAAYAEQTAAEQTHRALIDAHTQHAWSVEPCDAAACEAERRAAWAAVVAAHEAYQQASRHAGWA